VDKIRKIFALHHAMVLKTLDGVISQLERSFSKFWETSHIYRTVIQYGNSSKMKSDITMARLTQADVIPIDRFAVQCELQCTLNRAGAMEFAAITVDHVIPIYRTLGESYDQAHNSEWETAPMSTIPELTTASGKN
jgi:hypothetical protein